MIHLHPDADLLERYSMQRATASQTEFVEEHLLTCELCRTSLEEFEIDSYLMKLVLGEETHAVGR
jgi:hypothetical protein